MAQSSYKAALGTHKGMISLNELRNFLSCCPVLPLSILENNVELCYHIPMLSQTTAHFHQPLKQYTCTANDRFVVAPEAFSLVLSVVVVRQAHK